MAIMEGPCRVMYLARARAEAVDSVHGPQEPTGVPVRGAFASRLSACS